MASNGSSSSKVVDMGETKADWRIARERQLIRREAAMNGIRWEDAMNDIPFYSKRLTSVTSIDNIFRYQNGTITTEFVSGTLTDGTVQPPNSKLFEYIVMMSYLSKFGLLTYEGLEFRSGLEAVRRFRIGDTLLPCLCMQQTTGYTNNNALYDMDFATLSDLGYPNRPVALPENYANCLGVDIKIKGIDNYVPNSIKSIPIFDYADSIRAIDKLARLIDTNEYFIQFLGFYQNTDKSIKQITLNQNGMFKFQIDSNFAIACIGSERSRHRAIWLQLLKNKFLFFNVKNENLSTVAKMEDVWNALPGNDSGLGILQSRILYDDAVVVFKKIQDEINDLISTPDLTVLDLLKRGVDDLNRILPRGSLLECRSNSTQRNPQVRLCLEYNYSQATRCLIPFEDQEFPEIRLPKTKRQLAKVVVKEVKLLSEYRARTIMIKFLRAKHSDAVAYINRKWKTETGKASAAPVQYLFNHLLYYPYRRMDREGQKTEIQDTITRVINRRRQQIPVSYTFNISLLRRIKNLLKKEVREDPGVDTFGSLNNMLQRVHRYRLGQIANPVPRNIPGQKADAVPQQTPQTPTASPQRETYDFTPRDAVIGRKYRFQDSLRRGGGKNHLQITTELIIPTLLLDVEDLLNMDLKNYNLEDYANHSIWSTIKNLSCFIDSVNNDNYQNFSMKKMYDFWIKSEEQEFIVNILDPFKKIVITYNKYINKYFDDILKPKTIQDKHTPKHKPILTPSPRRKQGGGGRKRTRKKRRKKKKSRRRKKRK